MKVIKKYLKVVLCFMAFALCSFFMVFAPTITAVEATAHITNYANNTIKSIKMKKEVNASEGLTIPFLSENSSEYSVKVVDPSGYTHTAKLNSDNTFKQEEVDDKTVTYNGNGYFSLVEGALKVNALISGNYQVVYVVNKEGKELYSNIYNVKVKSDSYSIDLSNSLIKSEVKTSSDASDRIEIPVPSAKVVGDDDASEVKLDPETEIKVSYNGTSIKLSATGAETDYIEENGKYYIQPSKAGIYKIQYTYKRSANRPTKTVTIKVSDDFVAPTEFKVSNVPTFNSFELGEKDIELPNLTAKNEYNDNVDFNVKSIKIEKESDSSIYQTLETGVMVFDMTLEAFQGVNAETDSYDKLKGNYNITYTLVDAYGNECTYTRRIENVTISSKPSIQMVYDYEATGTMKDGDFTTSADVVNADTELKNNYGYEEIVLPAVYAEDAVSKSDELIVVRQLRNVNTSTIYYVDNLKYNSETGTLDEVNSDEVGYNHSGDTNIGNINKQVKFQFTSEGGEKDANYAGTYQLEYRVIAKNIAKRENTLTVSGSTKYTFTVLGQATTENSDVTPTVKITNLSNNIVADRKDTLNVKFTAVDDDDTRLKNVVYYYYGNKDASTLANDIIDTIKNQNEDKTQHVLDNSEFISALASAGYTGLTQAKLSEDGKGYDVVFATEGENSDATNAVVVAVSYNDYNNVSVDFRNVSFKNTDESNAPNATVESWGDFNTNGTDLSNSDKAKIGETINLPTISYHDEEDDTLLTTVSYYVNSPESETGLSYLSPSNQRLSGTKIVGGKLTIDRAGNYVVVYSATDDAGNTTISYFTFSVVSNAKPVLAVNPVGEDITISGNKITAEVGSTIDFDTILRDGDSNDIIADGSIDVIFENNNNAYSFSGNKEFSYIFQSVGSYTLTFTASYNEKEAVEKVFYVETTAQTIEWEDDFDIIDHADKDSDVYLPDVSASKNAVVSVKVKPNNGKEFDAEKVFEDNNGNTGSYWYFKTGDSKASYTVTYTAKTAYAEIEKSFTIKVGDNVPPTIKYNHKEELSQDIVYDGTNQIQIKFDVKKTGAVEDRYFKITATSNGKEIYSYDLGLNITDITDGSSTPTTMYWTDLEWEITGDNVTKDSDDENLYLISGTGTYTIKLSIKDSNDNETVENITFKVVSESSAKEKKDTVVGVVLIVISVVVLVGVILFFMFTGKKGGNNKSKKLVKDSKKQVEKAKKEESQKEEAKEVVESAEKVEETKEETVEAEKEETVETEKDGTVEAENVETESSEAKEGEIEE